MNKQHLEKQKIFEIRSNQQFCFACDDDQPEAKNKICLSSPLKMDLAKPLAVNPLPAAVHFSLIVDEASDEKL